MKKILILSLIMLTALNVNAQKIWINGYIFTFENGNAKPVPFATIKYCDSENHKQVKFIRVTDFSGHYDLGKEVPSKGNYYVEITAPGYSTRHKSIGKLPRFYRGNITLHFEMLKKGEESITMTSFTPMDIDKKAMNAEALINKIPGIIVDDDLNIISQSQKKSLKLLLNGFDVPIENVNNLKHIPVNLIKNIEVYKIGDSVETIFGGAINVVMIEGPYAGQLSFTPIETDEFDL